MTGEELAEPAGAAGSSAERLLDAADRLMHARGYHDVGVAELCRAAKVRTGSFYYYFESKEALAAAMLERAWSRAEQRFFVPAFGDETLDLFEAIERYSSLLEANLAAIVEHSGVVAGCRFGNFAIEIAQQLPLVHAATAAALDAMARWFSEAIERGQARGELDASASSETLARSLLAQMEGLMVIAKATGDPTVLRDLAPAARRLLAPRLPSHGDENERTGPRRGPRARRVR